MRFNDLPERCKDCQNLKVWALDMGGNHAVTCKKGIWNIKNDKCDKRRELNDNWSPCTTCAFSDCDKDCDVCMECDDRRYKE